MAPVIRIDDDVMAELKKRAIGLGLVFEPPNATLRSVLGLGSQGAPIVQVNRKSSDTVEKSREMDSRVTKLRDLVGQSDGRYIEMRRNRNKSFSLVSDKNRVFGFVYPQKERLKVEINKEWAEKVGRKGWEYEHDKDWFKKGPSVYWYVANDKENAYHNIARIIKSLRQLSV